MRTPGLSVSIVSESVPHLKRGAIRDFLEIMLNHELYDVKKHNKTDNVYSFDNGSYIEFFSADNDKKLRGAGRDILFINEANLLTFEAFTQLNMRTEQTVFLDYNPSDEFHWIYDKIIPQSDCKFIKSTYLNNIKFLPKQQIAEIEKLKTIDDNFWRIYGLGERGVAQEVIYTHYQIVDSFPDSFDEIIYGLDFGFNNPSGLLFVGIRDQEYYWRQLIYQSGLTNSDLIAAVKDKIDCKNLIYGDCAEPARIEEFKRAGFWIQGADKSVKDGIDYVKSIPLKIHRDSVDLIKELRGYKYKIKNDIVSDSEPVKINDHLVDAGRYASYTHHLSTIKEPRIRFI